MAPLTFSTLFRHLNNTLTYNRSNAFEVVSMDGENSVVLFFEDSNEDLQDWYESVHYNISLLNQQEVTFQNIF